MTRRAFVIGHPIAHSRSPLIHGTWIAQYGLDARYDAHDVTPEQLPAFLERLRGGEFVGGNVTLPLKEHAWALADQHDPGSKGIGAANTLRRIDAGPRSLIHASNTDYLGFLANLDDRQPGWDEALRGAIILGAGGAARAIAVALASRTPEPIHILNRTRSRAEALAADLGSTRGIALVPDDLSAFPTLAPRAGLLVNTTTLGMKGTRFDDLDLALLPKTALVTDIVYTPLITPLLAEAAALSLPVVDGLGMLLHQAVPGFEAWFGVRPEVTPALRRRLEEDLGLR